MRISDWSSDVCSSDLGGQHAGEAGGQVAAIGGDVEPEPRVGGVEEGELRRLERLLTVARGQGQRSDRAVALRRSLAVFDPGPYANLAQLHPSVAIRTGQPEGAKHDGNEACRERVGGYT